MSSTISSPIFDLKQQKKVLEQRACPFIGCGSSDAFTIYESVTGPANAHCFSCKGHSTNAYRDIGIFESGGTVYPYPHSSQSDLLPVDASLGDYSGAVGHTNLRLNGISNSAIGDVSQRLDVDSPLTRTSMKSEGWAKKVSIEDGLSHPVRPLNERCISHATCSRYNVRVGVSTVDGETPIYTLFPRHRNGELIGWKLKYKDNDNTNKYINSGGSDVDLFGLELIPSKGKKLYITEGHEDCLALYQVLKEASTIPGWEPCVLSLPDGASSALKVIGHNYDKLVGYEEIILCFDNDAAGKAARDEVCKALAGKVSFINLPLKDANQMVVEGRGTELKWLAQTGAKKYQPDGIHNAKDLWDTYKAKKEEVKFYPYPSFLPILNQKSHGVKDPSLVIITSGTGCGKSHFVRETMYHYIKTTNEKIAGMFLEEGTEETIQALISLELQKRIHLPNVHYTEEEEKQAYHSLFGDGRVTLYDWFGGMDDGTLLSKLRYLAITGHKFIFLDHLSIVVSEYAAEGGERERIETLMTKLAKFVKEFGIILFLVVHLRKSTETTSKHRSFEQGARPTLDDLKGSSALKQLAWTVIGLARNQLHEDPFCSKVVEVLHLKSRTTGETGVCDYLYFDPITGRYSNIPQPLNFRSNISSKNNEEF